MLYQKLASLLPGSWAVVEDETNPVFTRDDGAKFYIRQEGKTLTVYKSYIYDKNRCEVVAYTPYSSDNKTGGGKIECDSISFSAEKTEERAASDIARRFLPQFNIWYAATIERRDLENKAEEEKLKTLELISAALGRKSIPTAFRGHCDVDKKAREPRFQFSTGENYGDGNQSDCPVDMEIYVSSQDGVQLRTGYLSRAKALRVIEALKQMCNEDRCE